MALVQLKIDAVLHGKPGDSIIHFEEHKLSYVPEYLIPHLTTAELYKDKIEFVESLPDQENIKDPPNEPDANLCCIYCNNRITCLMTHYTKSDKITVYTDPNTSDIIINATYFKIRIDFLGHSTFNNKYINKEDLLSFLHTCRIIKHMNNNLRADIMALVYKKSL